ncbi:MAG TPA: cysteine--tRNA ligase [Candidatus Limnocylindrales bacterium]|jgi:cysteinyl-tRNA synthetase
MTGPRLRNTLTRAVEPVPIPVDGPVRMYTCGPTVYRWAHVGNLRSYLLADFIRRVLLYHGVPVRHVKNITDVGHLRDERFDRGEDRMLVAAGLESKTPAEIADAYEGGFHDDEALVNILPAHVFPRATEHVADMLDLAQRLEALGHAYVSAEGNLYYSVGSFAGYGRLSGNTLDTLRAGHRGDVEADKRDSADFALWKAAGEGRILRWPSPWGEGFPGWHLECSAMAMRYLGPGFELHTGGIDNVFPHHEDEIAQSEPITGVPPVQLWVHGEHLLAAGRKMAKSTGNFERVTELRDRGIDPLAFRYLALTVRYGRKLNYSAASIAAAAAALASLRGHLAGLGPPPPQGPWVAPATLRAGFAGARPAGIAEGVAGHQAGGSEASPSSTARWTLVDRAAGATPPLSPAGQALHQRFVAAIDDDLDLPTALAVVRESLRADIPADERRWLALDADLVLGLDLDLVWSGTEDDLPAGAQSLLAQRDEARRSRDWARADALRDELAGLGVELTDGPDGTSARRRAT